eukprot:8939198-Lingulodinium_polyedra.AAC.1
MAPGSIPGDRTPSTCLAVTKSLAQSQEVTRAGPIGRSAVLAVEKEKRGGAALRRRPTRPTLFAPRV